MNTKSTLISFCLGFLALVNGENNDPVVFVYGYGGAVSTWTYAPEIEEAGLDTYVAEVSPYGSNYDRACELYAHIRGLRTDYGICHSRRTGQNRFGPDFTRRPLFEEWGDNQKIHLFGHSMGGLTIRYMERLLALGNDCDEDTSELFEGGKDWITSVTTLASPLNGMTFFGDEAVDAEEFTFNLFATQGQDIEVLNFESRGVLLRDGERVDDYLLRLKRSNLLSVANPDSPTYQMSKEGARLFNEAGPQIVDSDRFYYAFAADRTRPEEQCSFGSCNIYEVPDDGMGFIYQFTAPTIGRARNPEDRPNDGLVNRYLARCPGNFDCKDVADGSTEWTAGEWHVVEIGFLDHSQVTARDNRNDNNNFEFSAKRLYLEHGLRLKNLPSTSLLRLSPLEAFERRERKDSVSRYLDAMRYFSATAEATSNEVDNASGEKSVDLGQVFFFGFLATLTVVLVGVGIRIKKRRDAAITTPNPEL